jgi:outer membrane protein assembly factor BamB
VRAKTLVVPIVVGCVLGMPIPAIASQGPAAWTQLGHDAGMSYHQPDETIVGPRTVRTLTRAWRREVVPPRFEEIGGGPAIADGIVYVAGFGRVVDGEASSRLYALDLATGEERWSSRLPGYTRWTPAIEGGVVIVAIETPDLALGLYAVDATTGEPSWFRPLRCRRCSPDRGDTWPAVASDGVVLAAMGGVFSGGYHPYGKVWAFDVGDGSERWSRAIRSPGLPIVVDGAAIVSVESVEMNADESILALDLASGEERWRRTRGIGSAVTLAGAGSEVFAGTGSRLLSLDATDGSTRWSRAVGGCCDTLIIGARRLFRVARVRNAGGIVALDRRDGTLVWTRRVSSFGYTDGSPRIVANGLVYVSGRYEYGDRVSIRPTDATYAVGVARGRTVAKLPRLLRGVEYHSLVIADGYLVKIEGPVAIAFTVPGRS